MEKGGNETKVSGEKLRSMVELSDLLPTICEIAGASPPDDIDGKSLLSLIEDPSGSVREILHGPIDHSHVLRDEEFK